MLNKMLKWIKRRFTGSKKTKGGFDLDNPFLIL
jgi:hypothetical protein